MQNHSSLKTPQRRSYPWSKPLWDFDLKYCFVHYSPCLKESILCAKAGMNMQKFKEARTVSRKTRDSRSFTSRNHRLDHDLQSSSVYIYPSSSIQRFWLPLWASHLILSWFLTCWTHWLAGLLSRTCHVFFPSEPMSCILYLHCSSFK